MALWRSFKLNKDKRQMNLPLESFTAQNHRVLLRMSCRLKLVRKYRGNSALSSTRRRKFLMRLFKKSWRMRRSEGKKKIFLKWLNKRGGSSSWGIKKGNKGKEIRKDYCNSLIDISLVLETIQGWLDPSWRAGIGGHPLHMRTFLKLISFGLPGRKRNTSKFWDKIPMQWTSLSKSIIVFRITNNWPTRKVFS